MFYWKNDKSPRSPGLFLEPQAIHTENLAVSGDTSYNIGLMGRQNESSECFQLFCDRQRTLISLINERFYVTNDCGQRHESICLRCERLDRLHVSRPSVFEQSPFASASPPCFPFIPWAQFRPSASRKS